MLTGLHFGVSFLDMAIRLFTLLLVLAQLPILPDVFSQDADKRAGNDVSAPAISDRGTAIELEVEEDDLHVSCSRGCVSLLIHVDFDSTPNVLPGMPLRVDERYSRPPPVC